MGCWRFRAVGWMLWLGWVAWVTLQPALAGPERIVVCHIPLDTPSNYHIITVTPAAVTDHLAHGDHLVNPEVCGDGVDNDCNGEVDELPECGCPTACREGVDAFLASVDQFLDIICFFYTNRNAGSIFVLTHSGGTSVDMVLSTNRCSSLDLDAGVMIFVTTVGDREQAACAALFAPHIPGCNITPP